MDWQILLYLLPYLISLAISSGVGVYAWRRRAVAGAGPFAVMALAQAWWTFGYVLELVSPSLEGKIFWDNAQFLGMLIAPLAYLAFAVEYTGRKLAHPTRTWGLLAIIPIVSLLVVSTDHLHGWIRPEVVLVPGEPFPALVYDFTVAFWLMTIYAYGLALSGMAVLVGKFVRAQSLYRSQVGTILIGTVIPLAGAVLTVMGWAPTFHRDMTPFTFAMGNLVVAWGLFRYRLFDIVPVARDAVIENMRDIVVVLDAQNRVIDLNPAAQQATGRENSEAVGLPVDLVFVQWPDLAEKRRDGEELHTESVTEAEDGQRHFELNLSPLYDRQDRRTGSLVVMHDITERKHAEETLRQAHDELEVRVQERTARLRAANEQLQREIEERRQAEEALQRRTDQMDALRQMGLELTAQLDLDALLHSIVSRAVELLGGTVGGLYLRKPDLDALDLVVAIGIDPTVVGTTLQSGEGLAGKVWQSGEPIVIDDYRNWEGKAPVFDDQDFRATIGVPVCWGSDEAGQRTLGVLSVLADAPGIFSSSDAELLSLFATQAAIAIENARLFQAEREQHEIAEALREAAQAMGTSLELKEILRLILDQLKRVLVYDTASVLILRNEDVPDLIVGVGHADEQMPSQEAGNLLEHSPLLKRMARSLQPVVSADVRELEGWIWLPGAEHVRSWLGIPLIVHGRMIGALMIDHSEPGFFGEEELKTAQLLAQHAAQAIENARMYDEARRHNRELALLNRVIAASATSHEIEAILETVCRELALAFDLSQAAAVLVNEENTEVQVVAGYQTEDRPGLIGRTIPLADLPVAQYLMEHRMPLAVEDAQADPRLVAVRDLILQRDIASLLLLPILIEDQLVGSLILGSVEPHTFTAEETILAQRVNDQVSGALARARLAETQLRLSAAVEQAAEAVMITNPSGIILYVNPSFERIMGYSRAEVIGHSPRVLRGGGPADPIHGKMWEIVTSGKLWQSRLDYRTRENTLRTLDMTVAPASNQAGQIAYYVCTLRDVTREVQLEKQFQQAQKMEALGRLAGGIAHDFNNLLTVMRLSTRMLERQLHREDPLWEYVQRIRETGERASDLTRQLLSFSRREVVEPQVLSLNDVIGDLEPMLRRLLGETIGLETVVTQDLWLVEADPSQMEQVLVNLVVNARDAMPEGGTVTIETANVVLDEEYVASHVDARPGRYVVVTVGDTGVGMDDEVQARVFEPFFTTKARGQGTGLGLATVFGIVKQNDGHIQVDSKPGQGTTFKIYLPYTSKAEAWHEAPSDARASTRSGRHRLMTASLLSGTETVLVVEDAEHVRDLAVRVLESCGYQVLAAGNGPEAIQIGTQHKGPIHLLLTDVVLPQMSGKDLAEQLQSTRSEMRVLYTSGYADDEIAYHGVLASGIAFLPKPFTIETLTQRVREVLDAES